ncbi:MAG: hypoxanthine phosphoribosyltransferase, partial [Chloroflexota bacterium]
IAATIKKLAAEIRRDYRGKNPLLIGILKGSFIFMADLARLLDFPLEVDFIKLSSYGRGRSTAGELKMLQGIRSSIKGRHVLVVEDIVDTGQSLAFLMDYLGKKKPASLKLCVMADKPSRRQAQVTIDYLGLTVPDKFIVGYGIDWDEKFRNLPYIGYIEL